MDPKLVTSMDRVVTAARIVIHLENNPFLAGKELALHEMKEAVKALDNYTGSHSFDVEAALMELLRK